MPDRPRHRQRRLSLAKRSERVVPLAPETDAQRDDPRTPREGAPQQRRRKHDTKPNTRTTHKSKARTKPDRSGRAEGAEGRLEATPERSYMPRCSEAAQDKSLPDIIAHQRHGTSEHAASNNSKPRRYLGEGTRSLDTLLECSVLQTERPYSCDAVNCPASEHPSELCRPLGGMATRPYHPVPWPSRAPRHMAQERPSGSELATSRTDLSLVIGMSRRD